MNMYREPYTGVEAFGEPIRLLYILYKGFDELGRLLGIGENITFNQYG